MSEMYRFYDSDGSLLYLGISLDALRRVDQHRRLVFVGGRWLCVARRSVDHVELVDLDTGSTIAWPANQPIERQVRRP